MRDLKIMYLDPLASSRANGQLFVDMAAENKLPGTEVHVATLPDTIGLFSHIEYRAFEAGVTAGILRATHAAAQEGFDALVIGCFYDTALLDARELSGGMIVTGPCIASCEIAASLCNRFGIIVGRRKWVHQMNASVQAYGYGNRLSGFYDVGLGVTEFQEDHARTESRLVEAGRQAVEEDYAEALILGCTMEIGFHKTLEQKLDVPVIDPSIAALKRAEYAATLKRDCGWSPSRKWSCEAPNPNELAATQAFDTEAFGDRIVVPAQTRHAA